MSIQEDVRVLYKAFTAQGIEVVYGVRCCGRVYLGTVPATKCRTCMGTPKSVELRQESDVDNLAAG